MFVWAIGLALFPPPEVSLKGGMVCQREVPELLALFSQSLSRARPVAQRWGLFWHGDENVSAATLHPHRSEVNSGQCTPIQPDSAHFRTFKYGSFPKFLPEQFLYIMDTPDSILVSVAAEMVAFQ